MMNDPKQIHIADYDYPLPDERIAKYPKAVRDESKLLLYRAGEIGEDVFRGLPAHLPAGALMVFNNTKVIQARLHFHKSTGALIEVFCLEPHTPRDYQQNFAATRRVTWTCLVGNLKKWKEGRLEREISVGGRKITLTAERVGVSGTGHEVVFDWGDDSVAFSEVLEAIGELPIPPYLNRATEESDLRTYQTVYSKIKGSVAAPTAGLHFTDAVLAALDAKGVEREEITLHVGAGTFKPVKSEEIGGHAMHSEWIAVRRETIARRCGLADHAHRGLGRAWRGVDKSVAQRPGYALRLFVQRQQFSRKVRIRPLPHQRFVDALQPCHLRRCPQEREALRGLHARDALSGRPAAFVLEEMAAAETLLQ